MTTIGIIGASGQVGTEVCLFLKTYPGIRPVAIVRSPISGALLRRLGVEVRLGTLGSPGQCRELLADCDMVADFSLPTGQTNEINAHYRNNISKALEFSRPDARYLFISSIDAFGMNTQSNRAKYYFLPRTVYAYSKRYGERLAKRWGHVYGKQVFIFRLGHVHGLLQRVSQETIELVQGNCRSFIYPDTPSYTVFCHSIAEGMVHLADGRETPGTYTLISEPPWSWKEVLEYYRQDQRELTIMLQPAERPKFPGRFINTLGAWTKSLFHKNREAIRAIVLARLPSLERKSAAYLYTMRARNQIHGFQEQFIYRPKGIHDGVFPGRRLSSLSDSRHSMVEKTAQVRNMISCLTGEG